MTDGPRAGDRDHPVAADLNDIIMAATVDAEFRRRLLADPRRAIEEKFGNVLPDGLRLRFLERDADVGLTIVLPDLVDAGSELSVEQLGQANGGAWSMRFDRLTLNVPGHRFFGLVYAE